MMRYFIQISIISLVFSDIYAQDTILYLPPLKIPLYLSGNFGEIRSDHFHSGVDFRTQGKSGFEVHAVEEGYVSRIKIQSNGYGKSIYIAHPGGHTSVYGHLDRYRDDIAEHVKKIQYHRKSHEVDIYPDQGAFVIARDDLIGYSGNTGSSSGPHLHFEIRHTGNQYPSNVLKYGFDIADRTPPRFISLHLYPSGNSLVNGSALRYSRSLVQDGGIYTIPYGTRITASGKIGFGVEVYDYLDGSSSRCGVYTLELYVDDVLKFRLRMDEFSFAETRYVNAHIDYGEKQRSGSTVRRLHRLPNDRLGIYDFLDGNGLADISEARSYRVRVVASDVAGNRSELAFTLTGTGNSPGESGSVPPGTERISWSKPYRFEREGMTVLIPAGALYDDLDFRCTTTAAGKVLLSPVYQVGSAEDPLHIPMTVSIKADGIDPSLYERLLLVTQDPKNGIISAGGEYNDGSVVASLRKFGQYAVWLDTVAPEIVPAGGHVQGDLTGRKDIRFRVTDDLSGISTFEGYIDNRWALFEYDPKNDLLLYTFDASRIGRGKKHELELYVADGKGNVNLFHTTFTW